ncbi:alanine racemase [Streptomyces sp. NPDC001185]|uniref:alanine racemase n=1 Tax=Streptomyces sp. NPDC001185 TaxID=3154380 RepID=UPI00331AE3A6
MTVVTAERHHPQLRLDVAALEGNIATMADWCASHRVQLAPHVKTTMSAPVVERQVAAGAGTLTVATYGQAAVLAAWGYKRLLIANEVVETEVLRCLSSRLDRDPELKVSFLVDSHAGVRAAHDAFAAGRRRARVLVDVGSAGGRTGVRSRTEARLLAEAVHASPHLTLVGVAGYEGVVPNDRAADVVTRVDEHCAMTRDVFTGVADLLATDAPVFTMGGSAFPDRVVAHMPDKTDVPGTVRLLRSGCYVTHDHGTYARVSPITGLTPALSVRAVVLSVPERGTAVLNAGKRELPHDAGLPIVLSARDRDGTPKPVAGRVGQLFDHHTVLHEARGLDVADIVDLGISHPCSAFSRWGSYLAVHPDGSTEVWHTDFGGDEPGAGLIRTSPRAPR